MTWFSWLYKPWNSDFPRSQVFNGNGLDSFLQIDNHHRKDFVVLNDSKSTFRSCPFKTLKSLGYANTERQRTVVRRRAEHLTRAVGVLLQLSVSRRRTRGSAWRGATAPLRAVHPAIADPAHLLQDRADEANASAGTAVHLPEKNTPTQYKPKGSLTYVMKVLSEFVNVYREVSTVPIYRTLYLPVSSL